MLAVSRDDTLEELAKPLGDAQAAPGIRSADGRTVRYTKSWSDARLQDQWRSNPGSAEYSMRLESLPSVRDTIPQNLDVRVLLHLRPGTTIQVGGKPAVFPLETREAISFTDAQGRAILLQPPQAYEQGNLQKRMRGSYNLLATDDPSVVELRVRFGWSWLSAKERQFPVILDPMFQTLSTAVVTKVAVSADGKTFKTKKDVPAAFGIFDKDVRRLLVKFDLPSSLPSGTTITRAFVAAAPNGTAAVSREVYFPVPQLFVGGTRYSTNGDYQSGVVRAEGLQNSDWVTSPDTPPVFDNVSLSGPSGGDPVMQFTRGNSVVFTTQWDATTLVQRWYTKPSTNNGIALRFANEACNPHPENCGNFSFANPPTWTEKELASTEAFSSQTNFPLISGTRGTGIRLIVFYSGPTLIEGQPITNAPPDRDDKFYQATSQSDSKNAYVGHDYQIPPIPGDRWQAITVRGLGPVASKCASKSTCTKNPPDCPPNEQAAICTQPLTGTLPLALYNANGNGLLSSVSPTDNTVSYMLLNGRRNANVGYHARVLSPIGTPTTYEVGLTGETTSINSVLGDSQPTTTTFTFSSTNSLMLWNVALPAKSNNRVDIAFDKYFEVEAGDVNYVRSFTAGLFSGANTPFMSGKIGEGGSGIELKSPAEVITSSGRLTYTLRVLFHNIGAHIQAA